MQCNFHPQILFDGHMLVSKRTETLSGTNHVVSPTKQVDGVYLVRRFGLAQISYN